MDNKTPPYNFLLITSDQQRWDTVGRVNPAIRTPNLDRLAERGVLFERGYTCNPVCTPARVSMLTGEYPSRHGCYEIGTNLPEDYPTVAQRFTDTGYFTGLLGKAHFQSCTAQGSFEALPRTGDYEFFRSWTGPYYGFEHPRLLIGHTSQCAPMHYGAWLEDQHVEISRFFRIHDYDAYGKWELPERFHGSTWVADETISAIDLAREQNKPFFLWSSFQDPHNPYVVPEPWDQMYDPADMPIGHYSEGEFDDKPPFYRSLAEGHHLNAEPALRVESWGVDDWGPGDLSFTPDMPEDELRKLTAVYYGMVSLMDHHIGRILTALEERGLLDRTVVVFTSDHGDYLGHHGLFRKSVPAYEDIQRVPFIVAHPECRSPGTHSTALQSVVDIPVTFEKLAGIPPQVGSQGMDQGPSWLDAAERVRDWAMIEFRPLKSDFAQHTLVTDRYKLVYYKDREYGELYDLQNDPDQMDNLYDQPDCRDLRRMLTEKMLAAEIQKDGVLRERPGPA